MAAKEKFILCKNVADFLMPKLEIGLEFVYNSFAEHNIFREGSSKPWKRHPCNSITGRQPHESF